MYEYVSDSLLVIGRIVTILPLLLFMTLYMGKRAIGELPIFDYLIIITLGAVVGADIADPNIKHFPTAIAVISIAFFQRLITYWKIKNRKVGRLLTFEPTVVIQDGIILDQRLKKLRYSIDSVLQMLREKDVFDITEVETAIIEANGGISVLKKTEKKPVTKEDMQIYKPTSTIALPIIIEGTIYTDILKDFNLDRMWLQEQLTKRGIHNLDDVFFASINRDLQLHVSLKHEPDVAIPKLKH
ncbi:DUF421 domain-containing protein [Anaerobacillus alkaliphilus]|uniref:DUF421 domain-containing protein n=1 Tax=Anaerobacillus alkaliphilus TaxID=1548597 RepID=A0A4Q0VN19_9BACI|nr:DUF421 domain-containing protein [Anaerobacillus alkaliphilus]RXI96366.1 DUF421 domain-containing protein [Anaerobacillus alkaliphilus]